LEDVYTLTRSISWARENDLNLRDGLELFDRVRGPHYKNLVRFCNVRIILTISPHADGSIKYGVLDKFAEADADLKKANLGFDEAVNILVEKKWSQKNDWITEYNVSHLPP
jgi:salicylate hydroxylase